MSRTQAEEPPRAAGRYTNDARQIVVNQQPSTPKKEDKGASDFFTYSLRNIKLPHFGTKTKHHEVTSLTAKDARPLGNTSVVPTYQDNTKKRAPKYEVGECVKLIAKGEVEREVKIASRTYDASEVINDGTSILCGWWKYKLKDFKLDIDWLESDLKDISII